MSCSAYKLISCSYDRLPIYRIDYGIHKSKVSLHVHFFKNGNTDENVKYLHPGDKLYEKHKSLFKGVK